MYESEPGMLAAQAQSTEAPMQAVLGAHSSADQAVTMQPKVEASMHAAMGHELEQPRTAAQQDATAADVVASKPVQEQPAAPVAPAPKLTAQQASWASSAA